MSISVHALFEAYQRLGSPLKFALWLKRDRERLHTFYTAFLPLLLSPDFNELPEGIGPRGGPRGAGGALTHRPAPRHLSSRDAPPAPVLKTAGVNSGHDAKLASGVGAAPAAPSNTNSWRGGAGRPLVADPALTAGSVRDPISRRLIPRVLH